MQDIIWDDLIIFCDQIDFKRVIINWLYKFSSTSLSNYLNNNCLISWNRFYFEICLIFNINCGRFFQFVILRERREAGSWIHFFHRLAGILISTLGFACLLQNWLWELRAYCKGKFKILAWKFCISQDHINWVTSYLRCLFRLKFKLSSR